MLTFIDGHVHVHRHDDVSPMLDAATAHFTAAARCHGGGPWQGVLLLAEMREARWYRDCRDSGGRQFGAWRVAPDPEDDLLLRASREDTELLIVAGRQVVTREGIEVLTLCTSTHLPDGLPLEQTLESATRAGALSVLPWGAGKWLGGRGKRIREALVKQRWPVWAGDIGARPAAWPESFPEARQAGRPLINGTDPLPVAGDHLRVGGFGTLLREALPASRPAAHLRERLLAARPAEVAWYGQRVGPLAFVRCQLALRRNQRGRASVGGSAVTPGGPETPDIETSSADYARRFAGKAGRYLLDVQSRTIARALRDLPPGTALDVGGGHGQLVGLLRDLGWKVTVHGTDAQCERNLRELHGHVDVPFVQGDLFSLPAEDRSYDLVIAVRLISHVEDWPRLVAEMCRVARKAVVIDYPSTGGLNALTPLLFGLKKSLEGNTRTYTSFSRRQLAEVFARHGFGGVREVKQFFMPMVVHRVGKAMLPLRVAEHLFRALGLTALAGSPVILRTTRQ